MLKAIIDASTFEALPADVKKEYTKADDGKYALQVEGMKPEAEWREAREKLADFRDNNRNLFNENNDLKRKVEEFTTKFKDLDPDKAREALEEVEKLTKKTGGKKADELDAVIRAAVDAAVKPLNDKLTASEQRAQESQQRAEQAAFREQVGAVATQKGVKQARLRHLLIDAAEEFEYKDGKVVAKAGKRDPNDAMKDLTPEAWLDHLSTKDPDLFERSSGGGAERGTFPSGNGNMNANARTIKVPRGQPLNYRELGVTEDQVIKGEVVIERVSQ